MRIRRRKKRTFFPLLFLLAVSCQAGEAGTSNDARSIEDGIRQRVHSTRQKMKEVELKAEGWGLPKDVFDRLPEMESLEEQLLSDLRRLKQLEECCAAEIWNEAGESRKRGAPEDERQSNRLLLDILYRYPKTRGALDAKGVLPLESWQKEQERGLEIWEGNEKERLKLEEKVEKRRWRQKLRRDVPHSSPT